jgi:hypothetical protein
MSVDTVKIEEKAKQDTIDWDYLILDAEQQIKDAHARISKLQDCIAFFKKQKNPAQRSATRN